MCQACDSNLSRLRLPSLTRCEQGKAQLPLHDMQLYINIDSEQLDAAERWVLYIKKGRKFLNCSLDIESRFHQPSAFLSLVLNKMKRVPGVYFLYSWSNQLQFSSVVVGNLQMGQ